MAEAEATTAAAAAARNAGVVGDDDDNKKMKNNYYSDTSTAAKVESILKGAGISSSEMDEVSLRALRELLLVVPDDGDENNIENEDNGSAAVVAAVPSRDVPPVEDVATSMAVRAMQRLVSDLTAPPPPASGGDGGDGAAPEREESPDFVSTTTPSPQSLQQQQQPLPLPVRRTYQRTDTEESIAGSFATTSCSSASRGNSAAAQPPQPPSSPTTTTERRKGSSSSPELVLRRRTTPPPPPSSTSSPAPAASDGYDETATDDASFQDRLLKMVDEQTQLILDLHFRMDELEQAIVVSADRDLQQRHQNFRVDDDGGDPGRQQHRQCPAAFAAAGAAQQPQHQRQPPHAHPLFEFLAPLPPNERRGGRQQQQQQEQPHFGLNLRETRAYKILALFFELQRREGVPRVNVGLLIKVFVMVTILLGRMNNRYSHRQDSLVWMYRYYIIGALAAIGFLYQSGYAAFLYEFFVKEDYPARIWNGEDVDLGEAAPAARPGQPRNNNAAPQPPRLQQQQQQPQPQQQGPGAAAAAGQQQQPQPRQEPPGWHDAIFRGRIPRQDRVQRALPGPIRLVLEGAVLVGSFFLSIFPMWTPEPAAAAAAVQADAGEEDQIDDDEEEDDEDYGDEDDDDDDDRDDEIPRIRPPVDPAGFADDE